MKITDEGIEGGVSWILRAGVLTSGFVMLCGGGYFLATHGRDPVNHHVFQSQPPVDRFVHEIFRCAWKLRARSIMQVAVLLLIATPISRVAFSLIGFSLERDRTYVVITSLVLLILIYSLIAGALGVA